jgi:hypothetical protein
MITSSLERVPNNIFPKIYQKTLKPDEKHTRNNIEIVEV